MFPGHTTLRVCTTAVGHRQKGPNSVSSVPWPWGHIISGAWIMEGSSTTASYRHLVGTVHASMGPFLAGIILNFSLKTSERSCCCYKLCEKLVYFGRKSVPVPTFIATLTSLKGSWHIWTLSTLPWYFKLCKTAKTVFTRSCVQDSTQPTGLISYAQHVCFIWPYLSHLIRYRSQWALILKLTRQPCHWCEIWQLCIIT